MHLDQVFNKIQIRNGPSSYHNMTIHSLIVKVTKLLLL